MMATALRDDRFEAEKTAHMNNVSVLKSIRKRSGRRAAASVRGPEASGWQAKTTGYVSDVIGGYLEKQGFAHKDSKDDEGIVFVARSKLVEHVEELEMQQRACHMFAVSVFGLIVLLSAVQSFDGAHHSLLVSYTQSSWLDPHTAMRQYAKIQSTFDLRSSFADVNEVWSWITDSLIPPAFAQVDLRGYAIPTREWSHVATVLQTCDDFCALHITTLAVSFVAGRHHAYERSEPANELQYTDGTVRHVSPVCNNKHAVLRLAALRWKSRKLE
jgi:hypothetical protein